MGSTQKAIISISGMHCASCEEAEIQRLGLMKKSLGNLSALGGRFPCLSLRNYFGNRPACRQAGAFSLRFPRTRVFHQSILLLGVAGGPKGQCNMGPQMMGPQMKQPPVIK
jgi:hypothetical protein